MRRPSPISFLLLALGLGTITACGDSPSPTVSPGAPSERSTPSSVPPSTVDQERAGTKLDHLELPAGEASLARNFYFIFDGSGSMNERPEAPCESDRFRNKLEGARWAVRTFLEKVPAGVNLGLYLFDTRGQREVVELGGGSPGAGRDAFLREIDSLVAGRGTPLAGAIRFGTDRLVEQYQKQLGYGEYRLVVVTDGQARDIPEAAEYARDWGVPIYAIGLCIGKDHPLRQFAVSYRAAGNFDDLARGLEETLAELPRFDVTDFDTVETADGSETEPR